MVKQYPYKLELLANAEAIYDETNGEFSAGLDQWSFHCNCRDEVGGGGKITTPDGEAYNYGSTVYLPKGTDGIKPGDKIRVLTTDGILRFEGTVARFSKDQFHSRLWV